MHYHCTHSHSKCSQPHVCQEASSQRPQSVVDGVRIPEDVVATPLDKIRKGERARVVSSRSKPAQPDAGRGDLTGVETVLASTSLMVSFLRRDGGSRTAMGLRGLISSSTGVCISKDRS